MGGIPYFHWQSIPSSRGHFQDIKVYAVPAEPGKHFFLMPCATAWNHLGPNFFIAWVSMVIQYGLMQSVSHVPIPISVPVFGFHGALETCVMRFGC